MNDNVRRNKLPARYKLKYHAVVRLRIKVVAFELNTVILAKIDEHTVCYFCQSHLIE